jgi:hypothetical protein
MCIHFVVKKNSLGCSRKHVLRRPTNITCQIHAQQDQASEQHNTTMLGKFSVNVGCVPHCKAFGQGPNTAGPGVSLLNGGQSCLSFRERKLNEQQHNPCQYAKSDECHDPLQECKHGAKAARRGHGRRQPKSTANPLRMHIETNMEENVTLIWRPLNLGG